MTARTAALGVEVWLECRCCHIGAPCECCDLHRPDVAPLAFAVEALPDHDLASNSRDGRLHWSDRARMVKDTIAQFSPVALDWLRQSGVTTPLSGPLVLHWTLYVAESRGDADGWTGALKPWADSLTARHKAGVGLIVDDGPGVVRMVSYTVVVDPAKSPRTELVIERLAR